MLWIDLLALNDGSLLRQIKNRESQPLMAQIQLDIYLLMNYLAQENVPILDHAPDYPFVVYPPKNIKVKFQGVGTNNRLLAVQYALWMCAVEVFNECRVYDVDATDYGKTLLRSYELIMMARKLHKTMIVKEFEPPMIEMRFEAIVSLHLEIYALRIIETRTSEGPETRIARHRNIGYFIQEIQLCEILPKNVRDHIVRCRDWHRKALAIELCKAHWLWFEENKHKHLVDSACRLREIETLMTAINNRDSDVYRSALHELDVILYRSHASGYIPHEWNDIISGKIYATLPSITSRAAHLDNTDFIKYSVELFPELIQLWRQKESHMKPRTESAVATNEGSGVSSGTSSGVSSTDAVGAGSERVERRSDGVFDFM